MERKKGCLLQPLSVSTDLANAKLKVWNTFLCSCSWCLAVFFFSSDSGDSFFITQHPLPEAVRSVRRHQSKDRSGPRCSPEQLADGADDGPSSPHIKFTSTPGKSCKAGRGWKTGKCILKKYSFPFLERVYQDKKHRIRRGSSRATHTTTKKHVELVVRYLSMI